jgi:hypothetical protein
MMNVTKSEKEMLEQFINKLVFDGRVAVTNDIEHKAALQLVNANKAIITKKKNYGRIAEIKDVA